MILVAATYVFFLLFAQFGFLELLKSRGLSGGEIEAAMASMGIAGLLASLAAGWLLARLPPARLLRAAFVGCAASALGALAAHGLPALLAVSAAIGVFTALLTVALATSLRALVPGPRFGLAVGAGTGIAYFVCNVPWLFEAGPVAQGWVVAAGCAVGFLSLGRKNESTETLPEHPALAAHDVRGWGFASIVLTFLLLVWLDSAAFATIQQTAALKGSTWGSPGQKLIQGCVHLLAALAAGWLIDRGRFRSLLHGTFGLFAVAFTLLLQAGSEGLSGPIYAVGISVYSVALVAYPGLWREEPGLVPRRWRAAVLYGVAGWLGSALGVGMAQHFEHQPPAFLAAATAQPAAATTQPSADPVVRGRAVYVAEGCIHCHSQYVREGTHDVEWWGPHRDLDRRERPPLPGNRRQGPDLLNVGARRDKVWQRLHLADPRAMHPGSRMPSYAHLFAAGDTRGEDLVAYLSSLGTDGPP